MPLFTATVTKPQTTRSVVVIGTSSGGIEALSNLVVQFPHDIPAAVLIVLHVSRSSPSILPNILSNRGPLPAVSAEEGQLLELGKIYVAPSDHHIILQENHISLSHGPRENRSRPSIDVLFRSAAVEYGRGVVGALLTGLLDDGTAGLAAIKQCGGVTVAQDPDDALYPDMPQNAINSVQMDHVVPLNQMGSPDQPPRA